MTHQHGLECEDLIHHLNDYIDGELDDTLRKLKPYRILPKL